MVALKDSIIGQFIPSGNSTNADLWFCITNGRKTNKREEKK